MEPGQASAHPRTVSVAVWSHAANRIAGATGPLPPRGSMVFHAQQMPGAGTDFEIEESSEQPLSLVISQTPAGPNRNLFGTVEELLGYVRDQVVPQFSGPDCLP